MEEHQIRAGGVVEESKVANGWGGGGGE